MLGLCVSSFDRCWIPDEKDPLQNLTGCLSHRYPVLPNTKFMGILSRFCTISEATEKENIQSRKVDILVILSGPEPQRTLLEEIMVRQLGETDYTAAIVCGMQQPCTNNQTDSRASVDFFYHLPADKFREIMRNAGIIICRSGYSTIMDLAELGLSAILVPTPGQPEQEYLAGFLSRQGFFYSMDQHNFNLQSALLRFRAQQKKTPPAFRTDTENYLNDLLALYEKKKKRHGQSRKEPGQNLQP
jgi:predicted glycosyltransferase